MKICFSAASAGPLTCVSLACLCVQLKQREAVLGFIRSGGFIGGGGGAGGGGALATFAGLGGDGGPGGLQPSASSQALVPAAPQQESGITKQRTWVPIGTVQVGGGGTQPASPEQEWREGEHCLREAAGGCDGRAGVQDAAEAGAAASAAEKGEAEVLLLLACMFDLNYFETGTEGPLTPAVVRREAGSQRWWRWVVTCLSVCLSVSRGWVGGWC